LREGTSLSGIQVQGEPPGLMRAAKKRISVRPGEERGGWPSGSYCPEGEERGQKTDGARVVGEEPDRTSPKKNPTKNAHLSN